MTTRAKYRSRPLLAAALATAVLGLSWAGPRADIGELAGNGWLSRFGCVGCAAGAIYGVATGGAGFVGWALWTRSGSATIALCAATCIAAMTE